MKNIVNKVIIDDIHFWSHQMEEHAEFIDMGLDEPKLKNAANELKKMYEDYHKKYFVANGIDEHKLVLDDGDMGKLAGSNINIGEIVIMNDKLRKFKQEIIRRLKAGEWLGWLWPSFIKHLMDELDYFDEKIQLKYNGDEVAFWNKMNSEHVGTGGHLLDPDPKNDELIVKSFNLSHEIQNFKFGERQQFIYLSLNYAKKLDEFHKNIQDSMMNHSLDSIIHPLLMEHIIREGKRSIYELEKMKNIVEAKKN